LLFGNFGLLPRAKAARGVRPQADPQVKMFLREDRRRVPPLHPALSQRKLQRAQA